MLPGRWGGVATMTPSGVPAKTGPEVPRRPAFGSVPPGGRLEACRNDKRVLARTLAWAAKNQWLDAACLWCCLLAILPTTPGGLGVVEGAIIPVAILASGSPRPGVLRHVHDTPVT